MLTCTVASDKCTRENPCERCQKVLVHFTKPHHEIFAAMDAAQPLSRGQYARPGSTAGTRTLGIVPFYCTMTPPTCRSYLKWLIDEFAQMGGRRSRVRCARRRSTAGLASSGGSSATTARPRWAANQQSRSAPASARPSSKRRPASRRSAAACSTACSTRIRRRGRSPSRRILPTIRARLHALRGPSPRAPAPEPPAPAPRIARSRGWLGSRPRWRRVSQGRRQDDARRRAARGDA